MFQAIPGTEFAGYRIENEIGRGGMATVYVATHEGLRRRVALKVLAADIADDPDFRRRFQQEARLAASIDHPNVIPVYESGDFEGLLWIAMRYVEGVDLGRLIERGRLDVDSAVSIASQVAAALDAAHRRGLIHRDVKPGNVLLDRGVRADGTDHAYLTDFGLARTSLPSSVHTQAGVVFGTVDYMAPEQVQGAPVDGRSDLYSLACVLYECFGGTPPFRRETVIATLNGHVHDAPLPVSAARPEMPSSVDEVMGKALAKDKADRYGTGGEFMTAVARAIAGPPPLPTPTKTRATIRVPASTFIGREAELIAIERSLSRRRLLTLTGVAGAGKSRLAIEFASKETLEETWIASLGQVLATSEIPQVIAAAIGAELLVDKVAALVEHLRPRVGLLVFDDCEHVVESCAEAVAEILAECPDVRILVTSREPLRIPGEITLAVPPLSVPDEPRTSAEIERSDAVRLFVHRAAEAMPSFRLGSENAAAVAEICVLLEGIPLAVELAAARVRSLSPGEIAARLSVRSDALPLRSHSADRRHRTMQDAIEWSYGLLPADEASLLDGLGVFVGSFSVDAVEAVCASDELPTEMLIDLLDELVSKSLLVAEHVDARTRFRLLEPVRRFADARLSASPRVDDLLTRHAAFYAGLAERSTALASTSGPHPDAVRAEIPNVRKALRTYRAATNGAQGGVAAAMAAGHLAFALGDWETVVDALDPLAEDPAAAKELGIALCKLYRDDPGRSEYGRGQHLLAVAAEAEDADALAALAGSWKGIDDVRARSLYERAAELDPGNSYALGNLLEYEAGTGATASSLAETRDRLSGALERCRSQVEAGENLPWAGFDLGKLSLVLGDAQEALLAYTFAIDRSTAPFMIETSARSLRRLVPLVSDRDGLDQAVCLLTLGLIARYPWHRPGRSAAIEYATEGVGELRPPLLILTGSGREVADVARVRTALVEALRDAPMTVLSGGTAMGVSALAGDISAANPRATVIGFAPKQLPSDVDLDARYSEIRRTPGDDFGAWDPLRYWADVLVSGVAPRTVRMLGIGGGPIALLEYRFALAFGAKVGVVHGTGGEAERLLVDPRWKRVTQLSEVSPDVSGFRAFCEVE